MTDSSTSEGWCQRNQISANWEENQFKQKLGTKSAETTQKESLSSKSKTKYSRWFPSDQNNIADALSRDNTITDGELTKLLKTFCASQISSHFRIFPLPSEISSYMISMLQKLPIKAQLREKHTMIKIGRWPGGKDIVNPLDLRTTSILADFQSHTESGLLMGAFAIPLRKGRFSRQSHGSLAESIIRGTISHVSSSFRDNNHPNPTKDEDDNLGRVLSRLFRAFRNKEPNPKQQKAFTAQVVRTTNKRKQIETEQALGQLGIDAFFWEMCSCVGIPHNQL